MESNQQFLTFAVMVATGAIVGLIFDFYRIIHKLTRPRQFVTHVTDLLFWLAAAVIIFCALLIANWAELRAYVFIGLAGGAFLYFRLLSNFTRLCLMRLIKIIYSVATWVKKLLNLLMFKPLARLVRCLLLPFRIVERKVFAWCKQYFRNPPDKNIPPGQ